MLTMATGSGKTFIAVHLLKKFADAGKLRHALFVCDRDELRTQGLEVWPESHWPGFALREADVFKTYMAWWCM